MNNMKAINTKDNLFDLANDKSLIINIDNGNDKSKKKKDNNIDNKVVHFAIFTNNITHNHDNHSQQTYIKNETIKIDELTEEDIKKTFDEKMIEEFSIRKLFEYDKVKEGDMVLYYSDMGVLSGSSGYILIRDGYVHRRRIVWRS